MSEAIICMPLGQSDITAIEIRLLLKYSTLQTSICDHVANIITFYKLSDRFNSSTNSYDRVGSFSSSVTAF